VKGYSVEDKNQKEQLYRIFHCSPVQQSIVIRDVENSFVQVISW
jgi:hypothetical protein